MLVASISIYVGGSAFPDSAVPNAGASEVYAIYSLVVGTALRAEGLIKPRALINNKTRTTQVYPQCTDRLARERPEYADAIRDYTSHGGRSVLLERRFTLDVPYELISETNGALAVPVGSMKMVYGFSEIGFNRTGDRAVLRVDYSCGGNCGQVRFCFLFKRQGKWAEEEIGDARRWCSIYF